MNRTMLHFGLKTTRIGQGWIGKPSPDSAKTIIFKGFRMFVTDLSRIFVLIVLFDSLNPFMSHPSPLPEPVCRQRRAVSCLTLITIRKTNRSWIEHHSEVSAALRVGSAPC